MRLAEEEEVGKMSALPVGPGCEALAEGSKSNSPVGMR